MAGVVPGDWPRWKLKEGEMIDAPGGRDPRYDLDKCNMEIPPKLTDLCSGCLRSGREIAKLGHTSGCAYDMSDAAVVKADIADASVHWSKVSKSLQALPSDYDARKTLPLYDFMFGYFPLAWLEVVKVAVAGNAQHNPGEKLHWARGKSTDQLNTAMRHLFDHGTGSLLDTDGCYHLAKVIWRLSAELQLIVEKANGRS